MEKSGPSSTAMSPHLQSNGTKDTTGSDAIVPVPMMTGVNRRYVRFLGPFVILFLLSGVLFQAQSSNRLPLPSQLRPASSKPSQVDPQSVPEACRLNLAALKPHGLSPTIRYARRTIRAVPTGAKRLEQVEVVEDNLFPESQLIENKVEKSTTAEQGLVALEHCELQPLTLPVSPFSRRVHAPELMFGVATTAERLRESIPHLQYWLGGTNATLVAIIPRDSGINDLETRMKEAGISFSVHISNDDFTTRYLSLIEVFHKERSKRPDVEWASFIDDDTFFPSMARLQARLSRFDSSLPQYLGSISEDFHQVAKHGFFAFGGAGIFVSTPLISQLHERFSRCKKTVADIIDGDVKLATCIFQTTTTKLSLLPELHQFDVFGNAPQGLFESGRPLLSIHHWKTWYRLDVLRLSAVSAIAGDLSILQRWRFSLPKARFRFSRGKPGLVLTNGFSIVEYPSDTPDLSKMERTWGLNPDFKESGRSLKELSVDYAHSLAPLREKLDEGKEKMSYYMVDTVEEDDGRSVRQVYIHKGPEGGEDGVYELVWTTDLIRGH
ncbi:MAG: hypothetical protein M1817_006222 [Caeruleum heppii]|nr:MAG: hypothetical protein M1817_006222 [Caeruleum heppii]